MTFSANMRHFMDVHSQLGVPPVTTLRDGAGRTQKNAHRQCATAQEGGGRGREAEFFTFALADGTQLNGWMVKPRDFDPKRKYPVVMYQYSGPGSQEVKDAWSTGFYGGGVWEASSHSTATSA